MKNLMILAVFFLALISLSVRANANVKTEIDKANKAGKIVFLVVTDGKGNLANAKTIADKASKSYKKSKVITMDRKDKANSDLVTEYRLLGAPVPLILVISKNGTAVGGAPANQVKAEDLVNMIPSPKLEEVYAAISNNKHAIVVFTKKSFVDKTEVLKNAKKAVSELNNEAVFVEVDIDDNKEAGFMKQLRIDKLSTKASVTLVINKQGQVAGTSTTVPDVAKLVAAAKTPVKSGCGPGCGPAGCGK